MQIKSLLLALAATSAAVATPASRVGPIPLDTVPTSKLADKVPDSRLRTRTGRPGRIPIDIPGVRGNITDITGARYRS